MMAIDDDMLMAFADGELDEISRARVERAVGEDADLRVRLERQQRLRATLSHCYALETEVPERFRALLETNVVDFAPSGARRARPLWQNLAALAATLLLGLALGRTLLVPTNAYGPDDGTLVARGSLATALDTQLASAQAPDAATRIGTSFTASDGRLCRTFDSAALAGLACRDERGWQLMMTTTGTGAARTDYRQASSLSPLVAQAAQEMMRGEPLDAEAERRARDSGWRRR